MARSSSRHLIRSGDDKTGFTAYCGHRQHSDWLMTRSATWPDLCTKCSSRFFGEKLKADASFAYRLGERLDLTDNHLRWTYKSIYPVYGTNDVALGFIAIRTGFGLSWTVNAWECNATFGHLERNETPVPQMGKPVKYRRNPEDHMEHGSFNSKEQALYAVPMMIEQGKLRSFDAVLAEATAELERLRQNMAASAARTRQVAEERAANLRLIKEQFAGLLAAGSLTNAQTVALTTAADLLGVKLA